MEKDAARCKGHSETDIQITQQATAKHLETKGRSRRSSDSPEHLSKSISCSSGDDGRGGKSQPQPEHMEKVQKRRGLCRSLVPAGATNLQHLTAEPTRTATSCLHPCQGRVGTACSGGANPSSPNDVSANVSPISRQPRWLWGEGTLRESFVQLLPHFHHFIKGQKGKGKL